MGGCDECVFSFYFFEVFEGVDAVDLFWLCVEDEDVRSFDGPFGSWDEGDSFGMGVVFEFLVEVVLVVEGEGHCFVASCCEEVDEFFGAVAYGVMFVFFCVEMEVCFDKHKKREG